RRKGRNGMERATRARQQAKCHKERNRLRSSFLPGRRARIRNRKSGALAIWFEKNSSGRKDRHRLRFYRRAFCRIRQRIDLRGLGRVRYAAKDVSRRVRARGGAAGVGGWPERGAGAW